MKIQNNLTDLLGIDWPIIQAPMIGGFTGPNMVAEVSNSGGLGTFAGGNISVEELTKNCEQIKQNTNNSFAVNFFVANSDLVKSYRPTKPVFDSLQPYLDEFDISNQISDEYNSPTSASLSSQLDVIIDLGVSIVSFTFGLPDKELIERLKKENITIIATATTLSEAMKAQENGFDAVVIQGIEAGGHRGSFPETNISESKPSATLLEEVKNNITIPIIIAGGIMDGLKITEYLENGASAAQLGTAFLFAEEAKLNNDYLKALQDSHGKTCMANCFTGKYARVIRNRFTEEMEGKEVAPFPYQNMLTIPIRSKATELGDTNLLPLWAGEAASQGRKGSAKWLMEKLKEELRDN